MTEPTLRRLPHAPCQLGEGPVWHADERVLYFVDIHAGRVHRYDPAADACTTVYDDPTRPVGGLTVQADGALLLFRDRGNVVRFQPNEQGGAVTDTVIESLPGEDDKRFNDVIADPLGNVLCGTMRVDEPNDGTLYRLNADGTIQSLLAPVRISNGMGFTQYLDRLFYIQTPLQTVFALPYDADTGELGDAEPFIAVPRETGAPDGMTVDAEDCLWVAMWGTGRVVRYSPTGDVLRTLTLPARNTTCPTFAPDGASPMHDTLYVTSATAWNDPSDAGNVHAGATFRVEVGVHGRPEFRSRVGM